MELDRYHSARSIDGQPFRSACYAPFVGLSFDVHGVVSVCSFTRGNPLGRVGETPLSDMWHGPVAESMREAVRTDRLERYCTRCAEEIAGGNLHGVLAAGFDRFIADEATPWPTRMEFALSNACNLECVMCSGEFSSAIRARREGLPPLRSAYTDEFVDELEPFLARLEQARFLGGEPFLSEMNFKIWDRMVAVDSPAECNVTTNGTQWSPRIEAVLDRLPFSIGVSLDGVRRETVESIRAGASFDRLMENLDRFVAYRDRRGTSLSLTFCLMVDNWREFGDYLVFGEERGCQVFVNTVRQPTEHSLYRLPTAELGLVVDELEASRDEYAARLSVNRDAWLEQLDRLARHRDELERGDGGESVSLPITPSKQAAWDRLVRELAMAPSQEEVRRVLSAAAQSGGTVSVATIDRDDRISGGDEFLGIELESFVGSRSNELSYALARRLGTTVDLVAEHAVRGSVARVLAYRNASTTRHVASVARRAGAGTVRLAAYVCGPNR